MLGRGIIPPFLLIMFNCKGEVMAEPMTREELIQYAKDHGIVVKESEDLHHQPKFPERYLSIYVCNEAKVQCYIGNLSGVIIIYIEPLP